MIQVGYCRSNHGSKNRNLNSKKPRIQCHPINPAPSPSLCKLIPHQHSSLITQLATNVVTDVLLTLSIAYGLWKAKTGWKDTDNLLARVLV
jgi:hypothetical protein